MKISKQAQREARQLFRSCLVNELLDESRVRQAVGLLSEKKPRGYVEILSRLHRLVKLELSRRDVRVENAVETSPAQAENIRASRAIPARKRPTSGWASAINRVLDKPTSSANATLRGFAATPHEPHLGAHCVWRQRPMRRSQGSSI